MNPAVAETVIQVGGVDTMLQVQECLAHGGVVGIMGDRLMAEDQSVRCKFLGEGAVFPTGSCDWLMSCARRWSSFSGSTGEATGMSIHLRTAERVHSVVS